VQYNPWTRTWLSVQWLRGHQQPVLRSFISLPDLPRAVAGDSLHVVPEALRTQGLRGGMGKSPQQRGGTEPLPHTAFAHRVDGAVGDRDGEILAEAQTLLALRA
jgi:hypothetical protein